MAIATMSMDITAPMGVFMPSTPMVVKRDKRVRRRNATGQRRASHEDEREKRHQPTTKRRAIRSGFVFDDATSSALAPPPVASAQASSSSATASTKGAFAFRVRKGHAASTTAATAEKDAVDAASATQALLQKKERLLQQEQKRQRLQKRQKDMEIEEQFELVLVDEYKLSDDQLHLYYAVRDQVKKEMRKTRRDFAHSAARGDILALTEKSLEAIKNSMAEYMAAHPPSQTMVTLPNPENARLQAMIESYEVLIHELSTEQEGWTSRKDEIAAANVTDATQSEDAERTATEQVTCELPVTREIEGLQKAAISQATTSAQQLVVIEDSMHTIDRLILQAEIKKSNLFDAFHGSAFKGYVNMADPKETLRSLLKLAPPPYTTTASK